MATRLIYQPKAYVFTKAQDGTLYNLTPYVTAGEVQRNVNQVSTATVTLRNPYRIFTTPKKGVIFHPQDPITIWLERAKGYPVRVFTGYLDNTPYYQLHPTTVQLQASCTLKRLLYTYFDPALPFITSFLTKYGWINTGTGTIISNEAFTGAKTGPNVSQASSPGANTLSDGSIAKLLWAVLYDIGQWDDTNIWIEPIPQGIVTRMQSLITQAQQSQKGGAQLFNSYMASVVGTGGHGSGGGNAGGASRHPHTSSGTSLPDGTFTGQPLQSVSGLRVKGVAMTDGTNGTPNQLKWANMIITIGHQLGSTPTGIAAIMAEAIFEGDLTPSAWNFPSDPSSSYGGLLGGQQGTFSTYGNWDSDATNQAMIKSAFQSTNGFHATDHGIDILTLSPSDNILQAIEFNSGAFTNGQPQYAGEVGASTFVQEAQAIVAKSQQSVATTQKTKRGGGQTVVAHTASANASGTTVYDVMVEAANAIASCAKPYGHYRGDLATKWPSYDCSGSVSYVLYAAGLIDSTQAFATFYETPILTRIGMLSGPDRTPGAVNIYVNANGGTEGPNNAHTFMEFGGTDGRYWGTTDGSVSSQQGAAQWLSKGNATPSNTVDPNYQVFHFPQSVLNRPASYRGPWPAGGTDVPSTGFAGTNGSGKTTGSGGASSTTTGNAAASVTGNQNTGAAGSMLNNSSAEAFTTSIAFPSIEDQVTSIVLGNEGKGLMQDQSLMPFVQQVAQSSLRSFQSLPNGDFFAFYPDYFGEFGHRQPYWMIKDIEILSGTINLTDDALATDVFAVGDNTMIDVLGGSSGNTELINEMFSTGAVSIVNAFLTSNQPNTSDQGHKDADNETENSTGKIMTRAQAVEFYKRFGARPLVQNYPQIRSSIFEMLMAYQQFMMAWSNQFVSPFTFTFMPELFPGGKVGFPQHGLQMYINQVTHTWDYEQGFTTTAQLSSPSLLNGNGAINPDLPPDMVKAIAEPVITGLRPNTNADKVNGNQSQTTPISPKISKSAKEIGVTPYTPVTVHDTPPAVTNPINDPTPFA